MTQNFSYDLQLEYSEYENPLFYRSCSKLNEC
jgi:hypothetical protein